MAPAGGARAHLHAWMEAARDIQAAWRAARFRERLAAGPARRAALRAGVVRLQALWRRRGPRQLFLEQRAAVMRLQARVHPPSTPASRPFCDRTCGLCGSDALFHFLAGFLRPLWLWLLVLRLW